MQARMDLPGSLELAEAHGRQLLEVAKSSPDLARQLARQANRFPHISRIRNSAHGHNSNPAIAPEINEAHLRLDRLRRRG